MQTASFRIRTRHTVLNSYDNNHNATRASLTYYLVYNLISFFIGGGPLGVMVNVVDCGIVVTEFELHLRYYVYFRTNTLGKGINPFILPGMG